jgi:hypothetical protein
LFQLAINKTISTATLHGITGGCPPGMVAAFFGCVRCATSPAGASIRMLGTHGPSGVGDGVLARVKAADFESKANANQKS